MRLHGEGNIHDFPMRSHTQANIDAWEAENTSASKAAATSARNGARKVHLHETCMSKQLALTFLQHPPAKVDTLLASCYRSDTQIRIRRYRYAATDQCTLCRLPSIYAYIKIAPWPFGIEAYTGAAAPMFMASVAPCKFQLHPSGCAHTVVFGW